MKKKVTICIPTFNAEKTIADTLSSILNQTYKNIQIKIFDNCSKDKTIEIIKKIQGSSTNISLIESEKNIGAEANFTRCMQVSDCDYTAIFHSDDIYLPNMVEEQVAALDKSEYVAVATHAFTIDMNKKITGERFFPRELREKDLTALNFEQLLSLVIKYGNFITCPSVLIKSEVLRDKIQKWNGEKYKTSADLDVWFRLSKIGKIAFITKPLMQYRVAEASISFNLKKVRTTSHDIFLVLEEYFESLSPDFRDFYSFLILKDAALRCFNTLRLMDFSSPMPPLRPFKLVYIKQAIENNFHFRLYCKILAIWLVTLPFVSVRKIVRVR